MGTASWKARLAIRGLVRDERALRSHGRLSALVKLGLVCEVLVTYVAARRAMSTQDVRRAVAAGRAGLDPSTSVSTPERDAWLTAIRLSRIVDRTLRVLPTDSRCLVQALVLSRLLSRRGIVTRLVIGAHTRGDFEAHAWVEYAGIPVQSPAGFEGSRLLDL